MTQSLKLSFYFFIATHLCGYAQSFNGLLSDNYRGVFSVLRNPASIQQDYLKGDINFFGVQASVGNDYYGVSLLDALEGDYDFEEEAQINNTSDNNAYLNVDILGPSAVFSLNETHKMAIFTRGRVFTGLYGVNGTDLETLIDGFDQTQDFSIENQNLNINQTIWSEIGVSYAQVLLEEKEHIIRAGASLKYLKGLGNAYTKTENFGIDYNATTEQVTTTGSLEYGYSENLEDDFSEFEFLDDAWGIGLDLGVEYEWRPKDNKQNSNAFFTSSSGKKKKAMTYVLKFGLSVTDLGMLDFNNQSKVYDLGRSGIAQSDFENIENAEDLETIYNVTLKNDSENVSLPTQIHFNTDWNINQKFFLHLNADVSLVDPKKANATSLPSQISLTPRFEQKWLAVHLPITYQKYTGFNCGLSLRAGPLYVGSDSLLGGLFLEEQKGVDIFMGLKIPIFPSK